MDPIVALPRRTPSTVGRCSGWSCARAIALLAIVCLASACGDPTGSDGPDSADAAGDVGADAAPDSEADLGADVPDAAPDTAADAAEATDTEMGSDASAAEVYFDPDVPTSGSDGGRPGAALGILAIDPDRGTDAGGTRVLVIGVGFTPRTQVLINGRLCDGIDFVDDETLLARVPANPAGTYDVKVADTSGDASLPAGFTYFGRLSVSSVEPAEGPERGGVALTVRGSGFTADSIVSVGGRTGIAPRVTATAIELYAPPGTAGFADVRVTNVNGSEVAAGAFNYYTEPRLDAIVPAAGPAAGGGGAALAGGGLAAAPRVLFGASSARVSSTADASLTVDVPAGRPGPSDVTVVTERGASALPGGYYYVAAPEATLAVEAVVPAAGPASGGTRVTVAGPGVGSATQVWFGTALAPIELRGSGAVVVVAPAGAALVDVTVEVGAVAATLTGGYRYLPDLAVTSVDPSTGSVDGGDTVVLRGAGFTAGAQVWFGPVAAGVRVVSDTEIEVTTPPGSPGPVDVEVRDVGRVATRARAFRYTEPLWFSSLAPTRGAISGGTRVLLRGRGFAGDVAVTFGDVPATRVRVIDSATVEAWTPPGAAIGRVEVAVSVAGSPAAARLGFVYYDPFSAAGGWWGDAIAGSVNATVIDADTGEAIEGAFVTLQIRARDGLSCVTNPAGQCTISEEVVRGVQTVSASAVGYSSATITDVDAENVVIALTTLIPPPPSPPDGDAPPVIFGTLTGLDKIVNPDEDEIIIGVIRTTTPGVGASNPPGTGYTEVRWTGEEAPLPYEMASRLGELAVVAHCGVLNTRTGDFRPLWMGVYRGMAVRAMGERYEANIDCDIPLDLTITVKFTRSPLSASGPHENVAIPFLDFGGEGATDFLHVAEGTSDVVSAPHFASLDHAAIADLDYEIIGQAVPRDGGLPFAVAFARDVFTPEDRVTLPAMLPPAVPVYPTDGGALVDRRFEWRVATDQVPDFYYAYIMDAGQTATYWEVWLPGDQLGFNLPYFPPGSPVSGLPRGMYVVIVLSVDAYTFDYDAFQFNDFGSWNWKSYSAAGWFFEHP